MSDILPRIYTVCDNGAFGGIHQKKKETSYTASVGFGVAPAEELIPYSVKQPPPELKHIHPELQRYGIFLTDERDTSATNKGMEFLKCFSAVMSDLKKQRALRHFEGPSWFEDVHVQLAIACKYLLALRGIPMTVSNCIRRLYASAQIINNNIKSMQFAHERESPGSSSLLSNKAFYDSEAFSSFFELITHLRDGSIKNATSAIIARTSAKIENNDVILLCGTSRLFYGIITHAYQRFKQQEAKDGMRRCFTVVVLDNGTPKALELAHIYNDFVPTVLVPMSAIFSYFSTHHIDKVLISNYSINSNMFTAQPGTNIVIQLASYFHVPVLVTAEQIKMDSRASLEIVNEVIEQEAPPSTWQKKPTSPQFDKTDPSIPLGSYGGYGNGAPYLTHAPKVIVTAYDACLSPHATLVASDSVDIPPSSVPHIVKQRDDAYFNLK